MISAVSTPCLIAGANSASATRRIPNSEDELYWSEDPEDLREMARRRSEVFLANHPGVPYPACVSPYDHAGHILIMRRAGQIVGGLRLNTARIGSHERLPLECDGFRIDEHVSALSACGGNRAELSGLFADAHFVTPADTVALYRAAHVQACSLGVSQLIVVAPHANLRLYRVLARQSGWSLHIAPNIDIAPVSERYGITLTLAYGHLCAS